MHTALLLAASLFQAAAPAGPQQNHLLNPGFEQVDEATGYPRDWQPVWGKPTSCAYTLALARAGVAAAMITDTSPDQSHGLRSKHVRVTPGRRYDAKVWVKIEPGVKHGFALYLEFWNKRKIRGEHKAAYTSETGRWLDLSIRLKAPLDARTATVLIYGSSATVGKAYFDDASLAEMERKGAETQRRKEQKR